MVRPLDEPPQFVGQGEPLRFADPPPTPAMNLNATQPNLSFVRDLCYKVDVSGWHQAPARPRPRRDKNERKMLVCDICKMRKR